MMSVSHIAASAFMNPDGEPMAHWLGLKFLGLFHDRVIRNIVTTIVTRAVAFACTVIATIIAGRYLGPSDFGKLNFALGFATLVIGVTELMAGTVASREIARQTGLASFHLSSLVGARFISMLAACVFIAFAMPFVSDDTTQLLLLFAMLQLPAWILQSGETWFVATIDLTLPNFFRVISHGVLLILTIAIVTAGKGIIWLMMAQVTSLWLYGALTFAAACKRVRIRMPSGKMALDLLSQSFAFGIAGTIWRLHSQSPMSLVYWVCGSFQAGLFAAASKFVAIADWGVSAFTLSLYPAMSEVLDDERLFKERFLKGLWMMCAFGSSLAIFVSSCSDMIMRLTFGVKFYDARNVLVALSPAFLFMFVLSHIGHALIALGGRSQYLLSACASAGFTLLLVTLLGYFGGAVGGAVGLSLSNLLAICISAMLLHKVNRNLIEWHRVKLPAASTTILVAAALAVGIISPYEIAAVLFGVMASMLALRIWLTIDAL